MKENMKLALQIKKELSHLKWKVNIQQGMLEIGKKVKTKDKIII